ncbi:MAG: OmpA family protein [Motiliproteus sp.]
MPRLRFFVLAPFFVALSCMGSAAVTFQAPMDEVQWQLESSRFGCALSQSIPDFGNAIFERLAGQKLHFVLSSPQAELLGRETRVMAEAPPWYPGRGTRQLGVVTDSVASQTLRLKSRLANEMLTSLYQGLSPALSNNRWYGTDTPVKVMVSAANFQQAYRNYQSCVSGLLPVNYQQIARSAVLFPSAQWRLSDATKKRLDLIALYIKNDPSVVSVFVDGHSDSFGRRLPNRDLSRDRADAVSAYLSKIGVAEEMMTTRYHGERYPVVENNSNQNRARNRRVTIRLEREE